MTMEIEIGGRPHVVEMKKRGGVHEAVVNGVTQTVDVAHAGDTWSLLIGARSYEVRIFEQTAGELVIHVNGRAIAARVPVLARTWRRGRRDEAAGATGTGQYRVVAPMPGRVIKLLVKPGDAVSPRQGLVVVEAMKMENELRAPRAGTVAEIRVSEGMSVEANTVLVIVEAP